MLMRTWNNFSVRADGIVAKWTSTWAEQPSSQLFLLNASRFRVVLVEKTQEFLCDTFYIYLLYASHFVASQYSKPSQLGLLLKN